MRQAEYWVQVSQSVARWRRCEEVGVRTMSARLGVLVLRRGYQERVETTHNGCRLLLRGTDLCAVELNMDQDVERTSGELPVMPDRAVRWAPEGGASGLGSIWGRGCSCWWRYGASGGGRHPAAGSLGHCWQCLRVSDGRISMLSTVWRAWRCSVVLSIWRS